MLDGFRGLMVGWVVFTHLTQWAAATRGPDSVAGLRQIEYGLEDIFAGHGETHPAVIGFIVLSGYVIHRNGLRAGLQPTASWRFLQRRFFRIFPLYVLAVAAGTVLFEVSRRHDVATAHLLSATTGINAGCTTAKALALSAVWPYDRSCMFQGNAPLVTAAAEIGLYLVYAAAFGLLMRWVAPRTWGIAMALLWTVGVLAVWTHPHLTYWWQNCSTLGFLLPWWLGAMAAGRPDWWRKRIWLAAALGASWVVLTIALVRFDSFLLVEARLITMAAIVSWLLVILDRRSATNRRTPLRTLGRCSYSLYAFHAPLLIVMLIFWPPWWPALVLVLVVGLTAERWIERPLTRFGKRYRWVGAA